MVIMTSEFDWFMVTMPVFAIVVYLIVMIGSMEKQPKILETEGVKKLTKSALCWVVWRRYTCFALLHDHTLH